MASFQNCGSSASSDTDSQQNNSIQNQPSQQGGGGVDGKTFVHFGICTGEYGIDSAIVVSNDLQTASLTRQNCKNLATPYANVMADVSFPPGSSDTLVYAQGNLLFDAQTADLLTQKVTLYSCQTPGTDPGVLASVWTTLGAPTVMQGQVTEQNPPTTTGVTDVSTTDGVTFSGVSETNSSEFSLMVSPDNNEVSFTTPDTGGEIEDFPSLICSTQLSPSPQQSSQFISGNGQTTTTSPAPTPTPEPSPTPVEQPPQSIYCGLPLNSTTPGASYECSATATCSGLPAQFVEATWTGPGKENRWYDNKVCTGLPTYNNVPTWGSNSDLQGTVPTLSEGVLVLNTPGICQTDGIYSYMITVASSTWLNGRCNYVAYSVK